FFLLFSVCSFAQEKPVVHVFYSSNCKACFKLIKEFIPEIEAKYGDSIEWEKLNTADSKNLSMLISLTTRYKNKGATTPSVLVGDTFLSGRKEVEANLEAAINDSFGKKTSLFSASPLNIISIFRKLSVLTVLASGLIDGVNPCAFAVIVFFVSFLALYGYKKREILYVGSAYCTAVFLTYLLIGLGFFKFIYAMSGFYVLIKAFYYLVSLLCFALAGFALFDYLKFKKTGETTDMLLQLPKFFKKKINVVIGKNLREKKERTAISLIVSSFVVGFLVSILEAVCTGQVYLPTIVFIVKNTDLRAKGVMYLLLYNLMFILPLVFVFTLSLWGFSSQNFNNFLKKNIGTIKLLMVALFAVLGAVILIFA
ncbi:MAG: hypothetical protein GY858_02290, partial [Candidatus Omnitrophica bacterium]|nr:hypothetical protein [Candidatus Omnitrophota bacterium]